MSRYLNKSKFVTQASLSLWQWAFYKIPVIGWVFHNESQKKNYFREIDMVTALLESRSNTDHCWGDNNDVLSILKAIATHYNLTNHRFLPKDSFSALPEFDGEYYELIADLENMFSLIRHGLLNRLPWEATRSLSIAEFCSQVLTLRNELAG